MTTAPRLRGRRYALALAIVGGALAPSGPAQAEVITTTDPGVVAAFQADAEVESFDDLPALAVSSYDDGQTVPAANQFSSRDLTSFTSHFFNSGGASFNDPIGNPGTRIGIFEPSGGIAGEAQSGSNVAGPLSTGTDTAFTNGFMEVIFPVNVSRVGFWVTHGTDIRLFLKDDSNQNLTTGDVEVAGSTGQFIGIEREAADVGGVTIGFGAFTIDDFTTFVPAPEASAPLGLGAGALVLALAGRRRARG